MIGSIVIYVLASGVMHCHLVVLCNHVSCGGAQEINLVKLREGDSKRAPRDSNSITLHGGSGV